MFIPFQFPAWLLASPTVLRVHPRRCRRCGSTRGGRTATHTGSEADVHRSANDANGALGCVPVANAERSLSIQSTELHRDATQWARHAASDRWTLLCCCVAVIRPVSDVAHRARYAPHAEGNSVSVVPSPWFQANACVRRLITRFGTRKSSHLTQARHRDERRALERPFRSSLF
jgi:hypothetical protein